jgi:hypothetical protein
MSRVVLVALLAPAAVIVASACDPPARAPSPCRSDIADCAAACALRERGLSLQAEELDRRCAAAVLGVDLSDAPVNADADPAAASTHVTSASPVDAGANGWRPFTIARKDPPGEPPECAASRILRDKRLINEAESMAALCVAKGGKP